ncbi:hypothetical protein [Rubrivirga sp. IMCC43871]|uniref:hypothetical protein n=1 Tax=Rubrivirga sp. IMCC43871 TaxID=3391575 RepID=UPI0039902F47
MAEPRVAVRRVWPTTGPPAAAEAQAALGDRRVQRAVHLVVRDRRVRLRFAALRAEGASVAEAVDQLVGPYEDVDGRPYYLSEERVRAVVYRKG